MNTKEFTSSALHVHSFIDCRRLKLSLSFYELDQEAVIELSNQLMNWVYVRTGEDFIFTCRYDSKNTNIQKLMGQLCERFDPIRGLSVGFEAYMRSPQVYNIQSLKKFQRYVYYENAKMLYSCANPNVSIDYPDYYNQHFLSGRFDPTELPRLIHEVFCEPNRKLCTYHNQPDLTGYWTADRYENHPDLFYGQAYLSFSAFCLGRTIGDAANEFAQFAVQIAEAFAHVNAHICLQPEETTESPYMRYFGSHLMEDGSHIEVGRRIKEWYPTYYLCDVAWMNILSPLTKQHVSSVDFKSTCNDISIKTLASECLVVRSHASIEEYSPSDAFSLKRVLSSALYPGGKSFPLKALFPKDGSSPIFDWCPRRDWAIVPIEEEEIKIIGNELVYVSSNAP